MELKSRRTSLAVFAILILVIFPTLACKILPGLIQNRFYETDHVNHGSPAERGFTYEDVWFNSLDGTRLHGWLIHPKPNNLRHVRGTVIHFHGNGPNISSQWKQIAWLLYADYNVFCFDYRGWGRSEGFPSPKGMIDDSISAINTIRSRSDLTPRQIVCYASSLGGSCVIPALASTNHDNICALFIDSTFFSYSLVANYHCFGAGYWLQDTYSPGNFISRISPIPLLYMHGTDDTVIPYEEGKKLFDAAGEPKTLITVQGARHTCAFVGKNRPIYEKLVLNFFDNAIQTETHSKAETALANYQSEQARCAADRQQSASAFPDTGR